ncbi:MAG: hypothetical protein DRP88_01980 [Candidatus Neomarinimicrobiota bacterium]|nr:MAG: hypothetical protein DRP88_01980 [Candidatus Neomarinimicrobiota bacterium]
MGKDFFHFYFPFEYHHRLKRVNVAVFFRDLCEFLRQHSGWRDEKQVNEIMILIPKGMKAYREIFDKSERKKKLILLFYQLFPLH